MISFLKPKRLSWRKPDVIPSTPTAGPSREELRNRFPDAHESHLDSILATQSATMTSPERVLALCEAVDYITSRQIVGDVVECGVWRGGSSAAAARTLLRHKATDRQLWLYDTFSGMTPPTECDVDFMGRDAGQLLNQESPADEQSIWCHSQLAEVKQTMETTGYPLSNIRFIEGPVEETLRVSVPDQIALLRLDTDWYESTQCELEILFPRLVTGGILIVDDYGHWNGCRKAVDEYFSQHNISMFLNRIDYTGRLGVKQS